MDALIVALAPAFAASIALQQLIEIMGPIAGWFGGERTGTTKKMIVLITAVAFAVVITISLGLGVLEPVLMLKDPPPPIGKAVPRLLDVIVTALFISGGTKGFNDLVKFVGYRKEQSKEAVKKTAALSV